MTVKRMNFFYSPFFSLGTFKLNRAKKSRNEIEDMGFGGEELLLGGRMFPIIENPNEQKVKVCDGGLSRKTKIFS